MPFVELAERTRRSGAIKNQRRLLPREENDFGTERRGRRTERSKKPSTGGKIDRSHGTEHQSLTHPIWITKVRRIGSPWVARRTPSVRPLISSSEQLFCGSLSPSLYLSLSRLSPIRLLQFETEYISRSATSTDARQDKWPRDGGYITFQNWPNRRLSGDEKEGSDI